MLSDITIDILQKREWTLTLQWSVPRHEWIATLHDADGVFVAEASDEDAEKAVFFAQFQPLLNTQSETSLKLLRDIIGQVAAA